MVGLFLSVLTASAAELGPGEFDFAPNARTLSKGDVCLHPLFFDSAVGVTDNIDLKFPTLGLLVGPSTSLEVGLVQNDDMAVSIEPEISTNWGFDNYGGGAALRYTKVVNGNRLNLNAGAKYYAVDVTVQVDEDGDGEFSDSETTHTSGSGVGVPLWIGYDLVASDKTVWNFGVGTADALTFGDVPLAAGIADWTHGGDHFRISLGVYLAYNALYSMVPAAELVDLSLPPVIPLPHVAMWWRI